MNKFFILTLFVLFALVFSEENVLKHKNTLGTVHDGQAVLSTVNDSDVLNTKTEIANPTDASSSPPGTYVPTKGTATVESEGDHVLFAGPLTAPVASNTKVLEGQVEEKEAEVTEDHETLEANVEVHKDEDVLETTEDYKQTLSAAINTARLLEVDAPEVLEVADSLEAPTEEDSKMLEVKEEESVVEEEPVNAIVKEVTH